MYKRKNSRTSDHDKRSKIRAHDKALTKSEYLAKIGPRKVRRIADLTRQSKKGRRELSNAVIIGRSVFRTPLHLSQNKRWRFNRNVLIDEAHIGSQVRVTGFGKLGVEFYNKVKLHGVYSIENFEVVRPDPRFHPLKNPYEIHLHATSKIVPILDDGFYPKDLISSWVPFEKITNIQKSCCIDLRGIVTNYTDCYCKYNYWTKSKWTARDIELVDSTNYSIKLTLSNVQAESFSTPMGGLYQISGVKIIVSKDVDTQQLTHMARPMLCSDHQGDSDSDDSRNSISSESQSTDDSGYEHDFDDEEDEEDDEWTQTEDDDGDSTKTDFENSPSIMYKNSNLNDNHAKKLKLWYKDVGIKLQHIPVPLVTKSANNLKLLIKAKEYLDDGLKLNPKYCDSWAAEKAGVSPSQFCRYLQKFRHTKPKASARCWLYDDAVKILQDNKNANGGIEKHGDRVQVATALGIDPSNLSKHLKSINYAVKRVTTTSHLEFHKDEMIRLGIASVREYTRRPNTPGKTALSKHLRANKIEGRKKIGNAGEKADISYLPYHRQQMKKLKLSKHAYCKTKPGISKDTLRKQLRENPEV